MPSGSDDIVIRRLLPFLDCAQDVTDKVIVPDLTAKIDDKSLPVTY